MIIRLWPTYIYLFMEAQNAQPFHSNVQRWNFLYCMNFVYWFMASFLYCFPYSYRSSNYCDSNSCCSFTLLQALAKSNGNLIAIAFKSDNYRYRDSWKSDNFRKEAIKKSKELPSRSGSSHWSQSCGAPWVYRSSGASSTRHCPCNLEELFIVYHYKIYFFDSDLVWQMQFMIIKG